MNSLCGVRLSTVGVVMGWFLLIGSIFSTVLLIVAFTRIDEVVKMVEDQISESDDARIRTAVIIALCVYLTTSLANVIASALLIVGTVKERHLLLAPWLINAYIVIFFNVLNLVYIIYVAIDKSIPLSSTLYAVVSAVISLVIQCVLWNAIYSLYKQLRANRDLQQRLLPTTSSPSYTNYTKMPPTEN